MDLIDRLRTSLASRFRAACFRARGMQIDGACWLRSIEIPRGHSEILLEAGVALDRGVVLLISGDAAREKKIVIGARTYINRATMLDASERIQVGADCMIGPFCYVTDHDHEIGDGSARPADGRLVSSPTRLEDRCWLGAHVTILKGVTVGSGAVVGAGSVVTKSLPPRVIAVGNPARVIRTLVS